MPHWLAFVLYMLVGLIVGYALRRVFYPAPWAGKLDGWKLDRKILRARPPYNPKPDLVSRHWKRPVGRAYCLRCGANPLSGPVFMYTKNAGFHSICWTCYGATDVEQRLHYAKLVMDVWICQNFDDNIRQGDLRDINYFASLYPSLREAVIEDRRS